MADPNHTSRESIAAIEASREAYVTEALLEAVRVVVARYRSESGGLPPHVDALDRLAAAYESYTRLFATAEDATASDPPPR